MRLGISFGYQDWGAGLPGAIALAQEADRLGYHSGWVAEAYGTDAITPITWLLAHTENLKMGSAIAQMPARAPAMTAMTAVTLDLMSGGRFLLGIGASGPQVSEGWYGEQYGKPLAKTREYLDILRAVWKREAPLEHHGEFYDIPYNGPGATGLGKPLKIIVHPRTADIPIYIASIGPEERRAHRRDRRRLAADLLLTDTRARRVGRCTDPRLRRRGLGPRRELRHRRHRHGRRSATTSPRCATR